MGLEIYKITDNFHLGADGKLYYTDVHNDLQLEDFCVDRLKQESKDAHDYSYDYGNDFEAIDFKNESDLVVESCHNSEAPFVTVLQVHYCSTKLNPIRKCCGDGENINVR